MNNESGQLIINKLSLPYIAMVYNITSRTEVLTQ